VLGRMKQSASERLGIGIIGHWTLELNETTKGKHHCTYLDNVNKTHRSVEKGYRYTHRHNVSTSNAMRRGLHERKMIITPGMVVRTNSMSRMLWNEGCRRDFP
jgi:hypothetical protein